MLTHQPTIKHHLLGVTLTAESAELVESTLIQYTNIRTWLTFNFAFDTGYGLLSCTMIDCTFILIYSTA